MNTALIILALILIIAVLSALKARLSTTDPVLENQKVCSGDSEAAGEDKPHAGEWFWACSTYPKCRQVVAVQDK